MAETKATKFDGLPAKIIGDHPHSGKTATCLFLEKTGAGWALRFKTMDNPETAIEFFVFKPEHIQWL